MACPPLVRNLYERCIRKSSSGGFATGLSQPALWEFNRDVRKSSGVLVAINGQRLNPVLEYKSILSSPSAEVTCPILPLAWTKKSSAFPWPFVSR